MTGRLGVGLLLAARASYAVRGSVFDRVVTALEGAMADAVKGQKTNDDEFKKTECQATELIDEAKLRIPQHQTAIEEATIKIKELRADNEFLSGEASELDSNVDKMTKELGTKTDVRTKENAKYKQDKGDYTTAVDQLGRAIDTLTKGTANLIQVTKSLPSQVKPLLSNELSLLQTEARTSSSGQVIGILTKLKEQFESNLLTMEAKETEAAEMFSKYKGRTEKQISSESAQSQSNKNQIADNSIELSGAQEKLKNNKKNLADMKEQLKVQSELLAEHKAFHQQLTAESEALKEAIQGAITLLTSNDAQNTMAKAADHMISFVQLEKQPRSLLSSIRKHDVAKAAGNYAWDTIFTAIGDMTSSIEADQAAADEKFATCEMQLKEHHAEEKELKASKAKNEMEKIAAEKLIDDMNEAIKDSKDEISRSTKEIEDTTNDVREAKESAAKETKEAQDASGLFKQAIAFLENYKSNTELEPPKSAGAAYETDTMSKGTVKVVGIIKKVETDMMKEIADLNSATDKSVEKWNEAIADAKDRIKSSKATIAESTEEKANGEATVAGADVFLKAANEGLASESEWWGPAPGHQLPSPGEECITYLGKAKLSDSAGREGDFKPTDKMAGSGAYHTQSKTNNDELAALSEMKSLLEGIQNDYLVAQPPV